METFKKLAEQKLCKYWETASELGGIVSRSLVKLIKDKPRAGWVKSSYVPDEDTNVTMLELRKQIDDLKTELENYKGASLTEDEELAQGDDLFFIPFNARIWDIKGAKEEGTQIATTWNDIFSVLSPLMVHEIEENEIRETIKAYILKVRYPDRKNDYLSGAALDINEDVFQTIKIQLRALGLIEQSTKKRSVKDTSTYWTLTKKGNNLMVHLRAIRRGKI